jgi:hypothetical protein
MNDAEHILMIVFIGVVIILVNIWRASIKRRLPDEKNQKEKIEQLSAPHIKRKYECDLINNPAFSDFEINTFYEKRPDDDD